MSAIQTLLWLEFKRSSWVLYGAAIAITMFAAVLFSTSGSTTALDMLNVPAVGEADEGTGESQIQMESEENENGSSFRWSFNRTFGGEPAPAPPTNQAAKNSQSGSMAVPEELQFAFRIRQFLTVCASFFIPGLMALGFWVSYSREADRGDMVLLYQSPVSGDVQVLVRFVFVSASMSAAALGIIAIYWFLQTSQSLSPTAPLLEALGGHADIHWDNLLLTGLIAGTLPNAAFILLYVQMQNAYDLLGGQRLVAMVLILASIVAVFVQFPGASPALETDVLQILTFESNPVLDAVIDIESQDQYRIEVSVVTLAFNLALTALMLFLSGRIWREVEWS
jgi:hypothetical protein